MEKESTKSALKIFSLNGFLLLLIDSLFPYLLKRASICSLVCSLAWLKALHAHGTPS